MELRKQNEQNFHDKRFGSEDGRPADRFYAITGGSSKRYLDLVRTRAANARVLEYGCGPGSAAFELAERGASVCGIDLSPVAIESAKAAAAARSLEIDFAVMDAERLTFDDASFDMVCGSGILHHLDLAKAFAEVARVLRPDGSAVFMEPLGHNPLINAYRNRTPEQRTEDEHPLVRSDFAIAKRFFRTSSTSYHHLATLAAIPFARARFVAPLSAALDRIDRGLFAVCPPLAFYAWLCVIDLRSPIAR